jgi:N-acetylmuramoyl-L-alanine amidase
MEIWNSLQPTRRELMKMAAAFWVVPGLAKNALPERTSPLHIENRLSPLNKKRPQRPSTRYIVLHTTEGEEEGSLSKIVRFGEAHYCISPSGVAYRIIDRTKIAKHAGRSMWEGRGPIDNYAIGIEVVGYHNQDITEAQYGTLRELLRQLKDTYHISDKDVVTHSMVAYGRPNRFHNNNHRGRKRCGMIFAEPDVRARLGLKDKADRDADVAAGRLKVGDPELYHFLFARAPKETLVAAVSRPVVTAPAAIEAPKESNRIDGSNTAWNIARERYNDPSTIYVLPDGKKLRGDQVEDWSQLPTGTRVLLSETEESQPFEGFLEIGKDGDTPQEIAGTDYARATTIYFFPDGLVRTGAELKKRRFSRAYLTRAPKGTRLLVGYINGGHVKTRRSPKSIAGAKWNYPSTYYRYPDGTILSGDDIDIKDIPAGTLVFYQE